MRFKKVTVLLCTAALCVGSVIGCFAEEASPVSVDNETRVVTVELDTIQYAGTHISMTVWQPNRSAAELAQGKTMAELSAYVGETTVVKTAGGNKIKTSFTLKPQADSGNYTLSLLIPGEEAPRTYSFAFSNLVKARSVLAVAQSETSTAAEVMAALDSGIIDVDVASAESYLAYGEDDARRRFVADEIVKARPQNTGDNTADMNDFIEKIRLQIKKISLTKQLAEAERTEMKKLIEENSELFLVADKMEAYNAMSESETEKFYGTLSVSIVDCVFPADVAKAFDAAYTVAVGEEKPSANSKPSNTTGGGGGGGGSSSNKSGATLAVSDDKLTQTGGQSEAPQSVFGDVAEGHWAKTAVTVLANTGVINGKDENLFCPNDSITREEFVKMLVGGFKLDPASADALPFKDVSYEDWFYKPIHAAYEYDIVKGISATEFGIGTLITRQDMAVMLYNTMTARGISFGEATEPGFIDSAAIAEYAKTAVTALYESGVISGLDDGTFAPQATATRAEAAKLLYEAMYRYNYLYV